MRINPRTPREQEMAAVLKRMREHLHISQTTFAILCGVSRENLAKYETARVRLRPKHLQKISEGICRIAADREHAATEMEKLVRLCAPNEGGAR